MHTTIVDDLRAALTTLAAELRLTAGWLREGPLWLALAVGLLASALAYQAAPAVALHVGGDRATRLRGYDAPFLQGFNDSEPDPPGGADWWSAADAPYRWATGESQVAVPGIGAGRWLVSLEAASGRPDGSPAEVRWSDGDSGGALPVAAGGRVYRLVARADGAGDLRLRFGAPLLASPGDPRELGFVLRRVSVAPLGGGPRLPAAGQVGMQLAAAALAYGAARRLGAGARRAGGLAGALGLAAAALIVADRAGLAAATPGLALLALACLLLAPPLAWAAGAAARAIGVAARPGEAGAAAGLALAGFAARMAGSLSPFARFSDLGFSVNNLLRLARGDVFLLAGLPCEAGAGQAPYPPALYLLLAPARLLLEDGSRAQVERLVQGADALLEGSGALLIWLALRRSGAGRRAALLGALLYVLPLPLLQSYSVGEMANLFGQALVPPLLLLLLLWPPAGGRRWVLAAGALVAAVLLSHTGVTISAACLLAAWGALALAGGRWRAALLLAAAGAGAAALAGLTFYSAYLSLPEANRAAAAALASQGLACPPGRPLGDKLLATVGLGLGPSGSIGAPLALAALAGGGLAAVRRRGGLGRLLLAAALGTALSLGTLLTTDQPVRWAHFLYPSLCLAAGLALGAWARRGPAGRALALASAAALLWASAAAWAHQIADYLH